MKKLIAVLTLAMAMALVIINFPAFAEDVNVCKRTFSNGTVSYMFPPLLNGGKCPSGYKTVILKTGTANTVKPPAVFSADGEFIGYAIGGGKRTNNLMIYNDDINYRFMVGNGDGVIGYYWPSDTPWGGAYSADSSCSETYLYKNRLEDVVIGKGDFGDTWPFNTNLVTTDSSQAVDGSTLKYHKAWTALTHREERPYCDFTNSPDLTCGNCSTEGGQGLDAYGDPLYTKPETAGQCWGYGKLPTIDPITQQQVWGLACEDLPASLTGTYHKVVPFTMSLPFKHPIAVPMDIRVDY